MVGDVALRDPAEDELDRAGFTKALAQSILTMDVESPFVFSIEGDWGAGKSTVLEFTKYYLRNRDKIGLHIPLETDPIIIEFTPWWFSGSDDLLKQFLGQISAQLRSYAKLTSKLTDLPDLIDTLDVALTSASITIPQAAKLKLATKALAWVARRFAVKDVASTKLKIEKLLQRQSDRIVVFLDDLDRLQPKELLQVFQVIKAITDLPRLIYVLSFDRSVVVQNLEAANVRDANDYLEKIVQSVWTLPSPDTHGLGKLTGRMIDEAFETAPEGEWQENRWVRLYFDGLNKLIRTPRDVKRLANALRPAYPGVRSEVNLVDFVGFHALRVLVPEAHRFIIDNREWLTNSDQRFFRDRNDERQAYNQRIDQFLGSLDANRREPVLRILEVLFPMVDRGRHRTDITDGQSAEWRREARICSADRFDFYERLSVPANAIAKKEFMRIIASPSMERFRDELQRLATEKTLKGNPRLEDFLDYAPGQISEGIPRSKRQRLLEYAFYVADEYITKLQYADLPWSTYDWDFCRLATRIVELVPKGHERQESISQAWQSGVAISLMVHCFRIWEEANKKYESGSLATTTYYDGRELSEIRKLLLDRILALRDRISKTPLLNLVLCFWAECDPERAAEYSVELASSDNGFSDLAAGALRPRPTMVVNPIYRSDIKLLESWSGLNGFEVLARCEAILSNTHLELTEVQKIGLTAAVHEEKDPKDDIGRPTSAA